MAEHESDGSDAVLIDYAAGVPTSRLTYAARLPLGGVTLSRCVFPPNPGITLGSTQLIVAVHSTPPFELTWRDPDRDPLQRTIVHPHDIQLAPPGLPVFHHWASTTEAVVIALDREFIVHTLTQAFERTPGDLPVLVGVEDPDVCRLVALCGRALASGGAGGRLYAESLATALTVHLYRRYGSRPDLARLVTGGLTPRQLHRVRDYIEAHLADDLSLARIAKVAELSPFHFAHAFRATIGLPPHRFVIKRRIDRARLLLIDRKRPVADIAFAVGFASQSHFTLHFRRLTGTTPARFRRERAGLVTHDRSGRAPLVQPIPENLD